jgi:hypothetical protein
MLYPQSTVYARGECISFQIQLACRQEDAEHILDLLSKDSATTVCLIRTTTFGLLVDTKCIAMGLCWAPESMNRSHASQDERSQVDSLGAQEDQEVPDTALRARMVHCELRLPSELVPSFTFRSAKNSVSSSAPRLCIVTIYSFRQYKISVLSFRHPRILPTDLSELITVPISVISDISETSPRRFVSKAPPNLAVPRLLPSDIIPKASGKLRHSHKTGS